MRIMSINRFKSWVAGLAGILLLASAARAQQTPQNMDNTYAYGNAEYSNADTTPHKGWTPFAPVGFLMDWQPFAPADISDYGNGPKPKVGFFFNYDRLEWTISRPTITTVGNPNMAGYFLEPGGTWNNAPTVTPFGQAGLFPGGVVGTGTLGGTFYETNGDNTSQLRSKFGPGNRWEFGYMDTNDYGWLVSVLDNVSQNQTYAGEGGAVLFYDPTGFLQGYVAPVSTGGGTGGGGTTGSGDADLNGNGIAGRDGNVTTMAPALPDTGDERTWIPRFQYLSYSLHTALNGVEIMRMYRLPRLHHGGQLDLIYGVRYFQLADRFDVFGANNSTGTEDGSGQVNPPTYNTSNAQQQTGGTSSTTTTLPNPSLVTSPGTNIFDNFLLTQKTQNNLVGPQVGFIYAHQRGRWKLSTEGRLFTAANFQNAHLYGTLGSLWINPTVSIGNPLGQSVTSGNSGGNTGNSGSGGSSGSQQTVTIPPQVSPTQVENAPANMHPLSFMQSLTQQQFSPLGELRFNAAYEFTRSFGVRVGYTAMYTGNIARGPNNINYVLPNMGILPNNHENVFINGLNVGFYFNR